MLIKICGVRTPEIAAYAALCGAEYVGIVFCPQSKRVVEVPQAKLIVEAVRRAGATPVGVFREIEAAVLLQICQETTLDVVQLHGKRTRDQHLMLPQTIRRFFAFSAKEPVVVPAGADPKRDLFLFDAPQSGAGQPFDWATFHYDGPFPWLLAGGLTVDNVATALRLLHPAGVDVSSGVEDLRGEKSPEKIKAFIERVRFGLNSV